MEFIKIILLPILLATASAYLAARFAFKKYTNEKRWDEKREKYYLVIESVEYLSAWYRDKHYSMGIGSTLSQFNNDNSEFERSARIIQKYAIIGEFYFSQEFSKKLTDLYEHLESLVYKRGEDIESADQNPTEEFSILNTYYSSSEQYSKNSLKKLLEIAAIDLVKIQT